MYRELIKLTRYDFAIAAVYAMYSEAHRYDENKKRTEEVLTMAYDGALNISRALQREMSTRKTVQAERENAIIKYSSAFSFGV